MTRRALRASLALWLVAACGDIGATGDEPIIASPFGDPCVVDSDCEGGLCVTSAAFPAGFCSSPCAPGLPDGCGGGELCLDAGAAGTACLLGCATDDDCRGLGQELACAPLDGAAGGERVCQAD